MTVLALASTVVQPLVGRLRDAGRVDTRRGAPAGLVPWRSGPPRRGGTAPGHHLRRRSAGRARHRRRHAARVRPPRGHHAAGAHGPHDGHRRAGPEIGDAGGPLLVGAVAVAASLPVALGVLAAVTAGTAAVSATALRPAPAADPTVEGASQPGRKTRRRSGVHRCRRCPLTFEPGRRFTVVVMTYRIAEAADVVGVPTTTLRYYEDIGLMPAPGRGPNGYRVYDEPTSPGCASSPRRRTSGSRSPTSRRSPRRTTSRTARSVAHQVVELVAVRLAETQTRIGELVALAAQLQDVSARLAAARPPGHAAPTARAPR